MKDEKRSRQIGFIPLSKRKRRNVASAVQASLREAVHLMDVVCNLIWRTVKKTWVLYFSKSVRQQKCGANEFSATQHLTLNCKVNCSIFFSFPLVKSKAVGIKYSAETFFSRCFDSCFIGNTFSLCATAWMELSFLILSEQKDRIQSSKWGVQMLIW